MFSQSPAGQRFRVARRVWSLLNLHISSHQVHLSCISQLCLALPTNYPTNFTDHPNHHSTWVSTFLLMKCMKCPRVFLKKKNKEQMNRDIGFDEELLSAKMAKLRRRQRLEYQDLLEYYDSHLSLTKEMFSAACVYRYWFKNLAYLQKLKKDTAVFSREMGYVVGNTRLVIINSQSLGYHMLKSVMTKCGLRQPPEVGTSFETCLSEKEWERWEGDQQNRKYRMNMEWLWQWTCIRG